MISSDRSAEAGPQAAGVGPKIETTPGAVAHDFVIRDALPGADPPAAARFGRWHELQTPLSRMGGHWKTQFVTSQEAGEICGALPITRFVGQRLPLTVASLVSDVYGGDASSVPLAAPAFLFLGQAFSMSGGGGWIGENCLAADAGEALRALLTHAMSVALDEDRVPIALCTPEDQVPSFQSIWPGRPLRVEGPSSAIFNVHGAEHLDDFIGAMPARTRRIWRRDRSRLRSLPARFAVRRLDQVDLEHASGLVNQVLQRHAVHEHRRITHARLALLSQLDSALCFVADIDDLTVGIGVALTAGDALTLVEIGLEEGFAERRDVYLALTFHEPISFAIAHGYSAVLTGTGHMDNKIQRGAELHRTWTLASALGDAAPAPLERS